MIRHIAIHKQHISDSDLVGDRRDLIIEVQPAIYGNRFCKVIQRYYDHTGFGYVSMVGCTDDGTTRISHDPSGQHDERGFTEVISGGWFDSVESFFKDNHIIYIIPA